MGDDIAEPGAVEGDRRIDIREQFGRMALDPARPETALLLAAMEEVEARTRGRAHAEHDPQPRAVVGAARHASLAVAEMRDAMRLDAHPLRTATRCPRAASAAPQVAWTTPTHTGQPP